MTDSGILQVLVTCLLIAAPAPAKELRQGGLDLHDRDFAAIAHDNSPGCGSLRVAPGQCQSIARALGYTGTIVTGNWAHAPSGCFVGHPSDGWTHTYFNSNPNGATGKANYRSICRRPSDACADTDAFCSKIIDSDCCSTFVKENCPKTCNSCGSDTATSSTTTIPTTTTGTITTTTTKSSKAMCCGLVKKYPDMVPGSKWGSMKNNEERNQWSKAGCHKVVGGKSKSNCAGSYQKMAQKNCLGSKYGVYDTIQEAQLACSQDSRCSGVYDPGCDAQPQDIHLCPNGITYDKSLFSCIYKKV